MKLKVYVETSIGSYLTARPAKDAVAAAHQKHTAAWWAGRDEYSLFTSPLTMQDAARGDLSAASKRLNILHGLLLAPITPACEDSARAIAREAILPASSDDDCLHLAICVIHEMEVLLTWNCKHLANANNIIIDPRTSKETLLRRAGQAERGGRAKAYREDTPCETNEVQRHPSQVRVTL